MLRIKNKTWVLVLFLGSSVLTWAQNLSMRTEMPFVYDVAPFGVQWNEGDYAVYGIYDDASMARQLGTHTLRILKKTATGDGFAYVVEIVKKAEDGRESALRFTVDGVHLDLGKARDILMVSPMGRFPLSSFAGRPNEKVNDLGKVSLDGKEGEYTHAAVTYGDGKGDHEIWIDGQGPYGVVQAVMTYGDQKTYYKLLKVGTSGS